MLHAVNQVDGRILWANLHLLFWLSLIPFVTAWMGENRFETVPVALYGMVLLMCALAYSFLASALIAHHGKNSPLALALGKDRKGATSILLYVVAVPLSLWHAWLGFALYTFVAILWFVPDRRIEKRLTR